jgi:hypothetical protein
VHFESGGNFSGNIGINFEHSHWNMGIDCGDNSIRMNANQRLVLEQFGQVWLQYNQATDRVEIYRHGTLVASF